MSSPSKPPFKMFSSGPRPSRSCSELPKTSDYPGWDKAGVQGDRSSSPSRFQEKMSSVQRRIQSLRPPSRSSDKPSDFSDSNPPHRRAQSAFLSPYLSREEISTGYIDQVVQHSVGNGGLLPPDSTLDWEFEIAEFASCLPLDHLEPPPAYRPDIPAIQQFTESQPRRQHRDHQHHSQPVAIPIQSQSRTPFLHTNATAQTSNLLTISVITDPVNTPNSFELEHWARMGEVAGGYISPQEQWTRSCQF